MNNHDASESYSDGETPLKVPIPSTQPGDVAVHTLIIAIINFTNWYQLSRNVMGGCPEYFLPHVVDSSLAPFTLC